MKKERAWAKENTFELIEIRGTLEGIRRLEVEGVNDIEVEVSSWEEG